MNIQPSRFVPRCAAVLVAVSACLATATAVEAQTPPSNSSAPASMRPQPPDGADRMHEGEHGGPGMHMMRDLAAFRTSLQLNAQQSALWDRALAATKPEDGMRQRMKARHDQMLAMLDDPNFDPRKMAAAMDRFDTEREAKTTTVRDAWFAVYDSLNPVQRGQAREFLRERMSHRRGGMHGHGGWMHRHDERGHGPMVPDASRPPSQPQR